MGIFRHRKDYHSPEIMERVGRMASAWPWNEIKGHKVGNFLLWHINVSWTISFRIVSSNRNMMQVTNVSHVHNLKISSSYFKK